MSQPGHRVIDALGTISCAPVAHEQRIADGIRERRTGTASVGAISLNTGTVMVAFQVGMTAGPPSRPS
jgi:hypothetical protein